MARFRWLTRCPASRNCVAPGRRAAHIKGLAVVCAALTVGVLTPSVARAQSSGLSGVLNDILLEKIAAAQTPGGKGVLAHTATFGDAQTTLQVQSLIQQVSAEIGEQVSTSPLGSSAGGFTYSFDSETGVFSRSSNGFGPAFADRAVTIGRHKWDFGANYVHASYNKLDGRDLTNGDVKFFLAHQDIGSYVQGDMVQSALFMTMKTDVFAMFANYGVTNNLDVGVSVPLVRISMNVTNRATILDFATHAVAPDTHVFANGTKTQDFSSQNSAAGIGDVVLRAKYNFYQRTGGGVAAAVDLRLPTGREQDFLGTGTTQAKLFVILSTTAGKFSPHANLGYTISGKGNLFTMADQINYTGGAEYAVSPRVTVVGDVVGRTDRNASRLVDNAILHSFQQGPTAPVETTTLPAVASIAGNLSSALLAVGTKVNPFQNFLVSAHVLLPVNKAGLTSRFTPVIGFEYTF